MTRIKIAALGLIVAALLAAPVGGSSAAASPQPQATKVAYAAIPAGEYRIDAAHSVVGFAIRHLEINWVQGRFRDIAGTIRFDDTDVTKSSVEFTAKVESIDTGVAKRDDHLRTADFFEVAKYPELTFKSTSVKRTGEGQYVVAGDFTLKGVTKRIEFPFTMTGAITDPWGNMRFGVDAKTTIDRRDYGITWGKALAAGGVDVGNEVSIHLALEAVKPKPKPAGQ